MWHERDRRAWARWRRLAVAALLLLIATLAPRRAEAALNQGPGGPILVVTSATSTFGDYYAEILRNEGLNAFAVADIGSISAATLAAYDVVVLAKMTLSAGQVTMLADWVNGGGNLIAMAPDAQLAPLLGLARVGSTLADGYLLIDTSHAPGAGLVNQTMQFHGSADRYVLNGAASLATLYSNAGTATANPALTLRAAGRGQAAAFAYDLATSIVYTRQGNPAWATQERDGSTPIRSDDKYFGAAAGDAQRDWIDLGKVAIPQADEQQRLLANLILTMNQGRKPLPRFWYFPNGKKAVVIMTGDDHANGGTAGRFDQFNASSPAGCSVANWECVRGTSYIYTGTPLSDAQATAYVAEGFEIGLHINTGCADFSAASLQATYDLQLADWKTKYASLPAPSTMRHHCVVWSDWSTAAQIELAHGIRLDTNYYFWPPSWVADVPGLFTGSAMPMRFSALDGSLIDVYQATSQMTDESGQTYPFTIDTLLDRALGAEGYYGAYTINAHTDAPTTPEASAVVASALARKVPIVSSRQMLTWLDGRNASSFGSIAWNGSTLGFTLTAGSGANGLQAMLPLRFNASVLTSLTRNGNPVTVSVDNLKGIDYAIFAGVGGTYVASYGVDTTGPSVTSTTPAAGAGGVGVGSTITAQFSEAMDPATINGNTFQLRDAGNALVSASVGYDAATRTARLVPSTALAGSSTYTASVKGGTTTPRATDMSRNPVATLNWSFRTASVPPPPTCPCSGWSASATPTNPSVADPNAAELGVKFRTDVGGFITGIRFYKGSGNNGTHIGNLWSSTGQRLASAQFSNETATGWQQVTLASPVAITANTVYVASYFARHGNYAGDNLFFASAGVDNGVVHLLRDGVSGGNGVYAYGATSAFPSQTYQASNYWVDVVFTTGMGPTPPR
jgi:hypothetical protein